MGRKNYLVHQLFRIMTPYLVNQKCSSSILNWVITQEYMFTGWTTNNSMLWYVFEKTQFSARMLVMIATARKLRADFIAMTYFVSHQINVFF